MGGGAPPPPTSAAADRGGPAVRCRARRQGAGRGGAMVRRRIRPLRWTPPPAVADAGPTAPFVVARRLPTGGRGPEDVMFDARGNVVTGTADGRILRLGPVAGQIVAADTGGRPLG